MVVSMLVSNRVKVERRGSYRIVVRTTTVQYFWRYILHGFRISDGRHDVMLMMARWCFSIPIRYGLNTRNPIISIIYVGSNRIANHSDFDTINKDTRTRNTEKMQVIKVHYLLLLYYSTAAEGARSMCFSVDTSRRIWFISHPLNRGGGI